MIDYFRKACVKNDIKKPVIVSFLDWLVSRKDDLCLEQSSGVLQMSNQNQDQNQALQNPLIDSLEQQQKFEVFIERFFQAIQSCPELTSSDIFDFHDQRQELVARISKILHCQSSDDLEIDKNILQSAQINSDEPMFFAAECFRDTLIEIGVNEESAETARKTFIALKSSTAEDTQKKIR